ncbi:MAG: hypothetical protein HY903_20865 [Deltaproteobacteria bacterium]|nr:hypothetical protein [Deltaproteobacteria bacterium]
MIAAKTAYQSCGRFDNGTIVEEGGRPAPTAKRALAENPLEGEDLLVDAVYGGRRREAAARPLPAAPKPQHYKIVSISLYNEDIARLEQMVQELKSRGVYKANKSELIRQALARLDLDTLAKAR